MKKGLQLISLSVLAAIALAAMPASGPRYIDPQIVLEDVFKSIDNAKTLTYQMTYSERLATDQLHTDSNFVKIQQAPRKIYVKMSDGTEVLWVDNFNKNRAYVHPAQFPYTTMSLDPDGSLMRKDQHHSVAATGYSYFEDVLKHTKNSFGNEYASHFLFMGEVNFKGISCYNLQVIVPDFKYVPYKVLPNETVLTIAKKLGLSEYMIMAHNKIPSFTSVTPGQTIMVPNTYAKQMTLYIDKTTTLPVFIKVEDEKGLFEEYTFRHITVNPVLTDEEFTRKNKEYHF